MFSDDFYGGYRKKTSQTLKWVHIAINNAKFNLLGVYHKVKGKYLQLYLDEFYYKLNREYFRERLFDSMVIADTNNYREDCGESFSKC